MSAGVWLTPLQGPVDGFEITHTVIRQRCSLRLSCYYGLKRLNLTWLIETADIMSDKPRVRVGSNWKRPPTKVYDYNYDVGQHYYQPMIRHLDKKSAGVSSDSPGPMSFAERLAEDPLYGRSKPANYVSVSMNIICPLSFFLATHLLTICPPAFSFLAQFVRLLTG